MAARRTLVTVSWGLQRTAARRAAGVDGHRAGRAARPDRPARRRLRPRLRLDGRRRRARPCRYPLPAVRAGPQPGRHLHPGRPDHPAAREPRRHARLRRPPAARCPTSASCTGPAATRSTTTRTSTGCAGRSPGPTPSSCTSRSGPAPPATPTSCCRPRRRSSATTSAAAATTATSSPCRGPSSPSARPATTTRSSPSWPSGSTCGTSSPRAAPRATGSSTSTTGSASGSADARRRRCPPFDEFWARGRGPPAGRAPTTTRLFDRFRADPDGRKLATPSGRIELFSETIDGFGYDDCPGHPAWLEPRRVARRRAGASASRCTSSPTSRRRGCTASSTPAATARPRRSPAASRSASIPTTPPPAASPTATSCGSSTTAASCLAGAVVTDDVRPGVVQPVDRRVVRPGRPDATRLAVRARQPQRAHRRPRHLAARPGLDRPARPRRDRALRRRPAAGPRPPPPDLRPPPEFVTLTTARSVPLREPRARTLLALEGGRTAVPSTCGRSRRPSWRSVPRPPRRGASRWPGSCTGTAQGSPHVETGARVAILVEPALKRGSA